MTTDIDYGAFDALTFDCYGTLIDWETGILAGLREALGPLGVDATDDELLEGYAEVEARLEKGPYLRYREILAAGVRSIVEGLGTTVTDEEAAAFGGSVVDWPAFPDSAAALVRLKTRFRLGSPPAIHVADLRKTFNVPVREAGLRAAVKSLVRRETREVRAVDGISFEIGAGRGRRVPRAERRRQDHDAQDALRPPLPDVGRGARPRPRAVARASRRSCAGSRWSWATATSSSGTCRRSTRTS